MRALITAAVLFLGPVAGVAEAGTVSVQTVKHTVRDRGGSYDVEFDTLVYVAAAGEANDVALQIGIEIPRTTATLHDSAGVSPGQGCISVDQLTAACSLRPPRYQGFSGYAGNQRDAMIDLGDGDDRLLLSMPQDSQAIVNGGDGNDTLEGSTNSVDFLIGGSGLDYLDGKGTSGGVIGDRLQGGPGADALIGPEGTEADYSDHTQPVHVDFEGDRDDGSTGENDLVGESVSEARGGSGDDELAGDGRANNLVGGGGKDLLLGRGGPDILEADAGVADGGDGDDFVSTRSGHAIGGAGEDRLYGRAGSILDGGPGRDTLTGSTGAETLIGGSDYDFIVGAGGNDQIRARDGDPDFVTCESAPRRRAGHVQADAFDFTMGCRRVDRNAAAMGQVLPKPSPIYQTKPREAHVLLGCPDDHPPACVGVMSVKYAGRVIGRKRFRVPAGATRMLGTRIRSQALDEEVTRSGTGSVVAVLRMRDSAGRVRLRYATIEYRPA